MRKIAYWWVELSFSDKLALVGLVATVVSILT